MISAIFILARMAAVVLLFWALREHGHNYYVVLRWLVCLVGVWGAYRTYREDDDSEKWLLVGFHLALVVVFNPLFPFEFVTWHFIDVAAGFMLFISTWVFDSVLAEPSVESAPGKWLRLLFGSVFAVGLLLFGVFILYLSVDRIMHGVWLWTNGRQTQAQISRVKYRVETLEDDRGRAGYQDVYDVDYSFTVDGKTYYGSSTVEVSPVDLGDEDEVVPKQPAFLKIEYQASNPPNNRALAVGNKLVSHIIPSLLVGALGLWPTIAGFQGCKRILLEWRAKSPELV